MAFLVYCVFRAPRPLEFEVPNGVDNNRVFTVTCDGLAAALSNVREPDGSQNPMRLLAYERVVDCIYRDVTVIPMRYGCRVGDVYEAAIMLRGNHKAYDTLLQQLAGLAEVGMQVHPGDAVVAQAADRSAMLPEWVPALPRMAGTAHLLPRPLGFCPPGGTTRAQHALVKDLCGSLRDQFVRHKVEFPSPGESALLSMRFLVHRESVNSFCHAARHLMVSQPFKLHFGGPWPPYSFVDAMQC